MQVKWLRRALSNLDEAVGRISKDNPKAALDFVTAVINTVDRISDFPGLGKTGRVLGVREITVQGYPCIIPYRVAGDDWQILRVLHVHQQRPEEWPQSCRGR
ncbi:MULTISPECIES: type II toxin-antitoxin system RelE/ParE family toxin [Pseudomonadaceae]|jgi:addiction module RelE/StbE family toxin|uniref:type II toxin-antitoxin system RelE/ParE family toxin n=1 Tax=Pseudomonadaceae TaxID=135621 RepID=UPI000F86B2C0|nr:type II toxin-antitoxin system RelE/ParE family toxin [Pseudomonas aeruginosa]HBO8800494.1 type II toxin-antitoxin system RelE/ParE family toxin [Pseudomonas aeruginosa]HBO9173950.1 type II toxin-antitoxin system RelE/ParE family toxin [Pseudomonas aeruginosa]